MPWPFRRIRSQYIRPTCASVASNYPRLIKMVWLATLYRTDYPFEIVQARFRTQRYDDERIRHYLIRIGTLSQLGDSRLAMDGNGWSDSVRCPSSSWLTV